jgi:tetratricopeptide (TPR) repeat protein
VTVKRVVYCAPSPLNSTVRIRTDVESTALLAAARSAGRAITITALVPATIDSLCPMPDVSANPSIIHLTAHAGPNGVEFEALDGTAAVVSARTVAETLAQSRPQVVVLNGCETERIGRILERISPAAAICTSAFLPDQVADRFAETFYRRLFIAGNVGDSFRFARDKLRELTGVAPYYLFNGTSSPSIAFDEGAPIVEQSFLQHRARLDVGESRCRQADLARLYHVISAARESVTWVVGQPLSGISTFLRMAASYYWWMFDHRAVYVDLADARNLLEIETTLARAVGQSQRISCRDFAEAYSCLVCFDHFGRADTQRISRDLHEALADLAPYARAHILVGTGPAGPYESEPVRRFVLQDLDEEDALHLLLKGVGSGREARLRRLLTQVPKLPGRLALVSSDIRNGADDSTLHRLIEEGDERSGFHRYIQRLTAEWPTRLLSRCLAQSGTRVPRRAVEDAFAAASPLDKDADVHPHFEVAVAVFRTAGLLWLEEKQARAGEEPLAYFCSPADLHRAVRSHVNPGPPGEIHDTLDAYVSCALSMDEDKSLSDNSDAAWISRVAAECATSGDDRLRVRCTEMGAAFLGLRGTLRFSSSPAVDALARASFDCAREVGRTDLACHLGLIVGERSFKAGDLDDAEDAFRQSLAVSPSPHRELQALRALGQVKYRRGRYHEALRLYDEASLRVEEVLGSSPHQPDRVSPEESVATLRHHRAKVLFRLGRYSDAAAELTQIVDFRIARKDIRGALRAQHELARVYQAEGRVEDAERLYRLVIVGAEVDRFDRFLPAPLYQMCLLQLGRGMVEDAGVLCQRCLELAHAFNDSLFLALGQLASGMIEFARDDMSAGAEHVLNAIAIARRYGFDQVTEDARTWLLSQKTLRSTDLARSPAPMLAELPDGKVAKAKRYATQVGRIKELVIRLESDSAVRELRWVKGAWTCSCELFADIGRCSHLLAILLMDNLAFPTA